MVVGRECPLFSLRVVIVWRIRSVRSCAGLSSTVGYFSHSEKEKVEGQSSVERCFSSSQLPGHVGALTCSASWVINPSRWMRH